MGTMYDSVNADAIPGDAQIVAGYGDGKYAWKEEHWARFPMSKRIVILTQHGTDIPITGRPIIYCSDSTIGAVRSAMEQAGLRDYDLWTAEPNNVPHVSNGAVATQWAWPPHTPGQYDISQTIDNWPAEVWSVCIDIEQGDFTPEQAVEYIKTHLVQLPEAPVNSEEAPNTARPVNPADTDEPTLAPDTNQAPEPDATGTKTLDAPIVAAFSLPQGQGYWLVDAEGGVYSFGGAPFLGSVPQMIADGQIERLHAPIVGIVAYDHTGYMLIGEDGGTIPFGSYVAAGSA